MLTYRTKDLVEATVLKLLCADKFRGMEERKGDTGVYEFVFDEDEALLEVVNKLPKGELLVEPATFASMLRLLKNMLYTSKRLF